MPHHCPECLTEFEGSVRFCPEHGARLIDGQAPSDPFVGQVLDERFRLIEPIGSGGMGNVYRAKQLSIDRDVAVKLLRTAATLEHESRDRFLREAQVISDFTHPNIVRLIDFGWEDDDQIPYLVMELIDGTDLAELMFGNRLDARLAVEIARQVCTGLIEAHAANVIHRDLKPGNILLVPVSDGSFQAKLVDFGIALPTDASLRLTSTGMICGTPHYIAPEQARGDDVGPPADLYSLGIILFEMLAGTLPFHADSEFELLVKHTDEQPPSLGQLIDPADVPDSLIGLVDGLLAKHPTSRPENALALRKRFDAVLDDFDGPPIELDPSTEPRFAFDDWRYPVDSPDADTTPEHRRVGAHSDEFAHADTAFIGNDGPGGDDPSAPVPTETHHLEEKSRPEEPVQTRQPADVNPLDQTDDSGDDNHLLLVGVGLGTVVFALSLTVVMLTTGEETPPVEPSPELPTADDSPSTIGAGSPDQPDPLVAESETDAGDGAAGEDDTGTTASVDAQPADQPRADQPEPAADESTGTEQPSRTPPPADPEPQPAAPPSQPDRAGQTDNNAPADDQAAGGEKGEPLDDKIQQETDKLFDDW